MKMETVEKILEGDVKAAAMLMGGIEDEDKYLINGRTRKEVLKWTVEKAQRKF